MDFDQTVVLGIGFTIQNLPSDHHSGFRMFQTPSGVLGLGSRQGVGTHDSHVVYVFVLLS